MLLRRSDGIEFLIKVTVDDAWLEFGLFVSPGGLFTGGTAGVAPTASDMITATPGFEIYGNSGTGDTQYVQHIWQSTDATCTRLIVFVGQNPVFEFGIAAPATPDPSWTTPIVVEFQVPSNHSQTSPNTILSRNAPSGWIGTTFMSALVAPSLAVAITATVVPISSSANQISSKWPLYNSYLSGQTSGADGILGKMRDVWWWGGPDGHAFTNIGIYNDGHGNYLIVVNSMVLPWLPGVVPAGVSLAAVGPFFGLA